MELMSKSAILCHIMTVVPQKKALIPIWAKLHGAWVIISMEFICRENQAYTK